MPQKGICILSKLTKYTKTIKYSHIGTMLLMALLVFVFSPSVAQYSAKNDTSNLFAVYINGVHVGNVNDSSKVDGLIMEARKRIARENEGLTLIYYDLVLTGSKANFGHTDDDETIIENIYREFLNDSKKTKEAVYEIKINEFTVDLKTSEEVLMLLTRAKDMYDPKGAYSVDLVLDPERELNVLTTNVTKKEEADQETSKYPLPTAGLTQKVEQFYNDAINNSDVSDFELGVKSLDFAETIEVIQAYVDADEVSTLDEAIEAVTKESEKSKIYVVESGDTLGVIAEKNDTTIADIIAMNKENIPSETATIRIGDEIKVTSPEPELSVLRTEEVYYEEEYNADVQYVDNDEWYTTDSKVIQQPVAGFRKVIADVVYRNDEESDRQIVYEDVVSEAVPKIVERGTKTPPTYIKPISGGRLSSGFGRRKSPTKGASTYHKGIDWATPVGTAVAASCGGTVVRAGWGSGYGYCVYINHPDGRQTRYGHLSKVLVKTGQKIGRAHV